ncbi:uncharacterized protein LOC117337608 [Pecten maximus]|uniref:uncharacterized protein LOC117337608 n=1 Tax=Pecten maximus TaxID=6579 RepID=UPI0014583639|nr:uncharacterized protein LOC117337608 [Pecten maximus]
MVPRDKMAILGINCLIFLISTGSFVKCMIYESEAGTWETTRNTCQLLNSSILCAGDPDTCNLKNDVTISTGQFWIGAYVHATTITFYTGCKPVSNQASPVLNSSNMTLKACIEKCHTKYQIDSNMDTLGLHMDSCYCTTRVGQTSHESECNISCTEDSSVACGGSQFMSTYEFHNVGRTQKGGLLSFSPLCGISSNKFKDCQEQRVAACLNDQNSPTAMTWSAAKQWCQSNDTLLHSTPNSSTFKMEPWINLVKRRFVKWTDEAVPEATTHCVSLLCKEESCSFSSEKCTKQLSSLCSKTADDDNPSQVSQRTFSPPTSTHLVSAEPPLPTPTDKANSSIPIVGVSHSEGSSDDGMLVYILVAVAVVVVLVITIILAFIFFRKRKMNQDKPRSKSNSSNIEEPARPLMEQPVHEHRGSDDYDQVKSDYSKVREDFVIDRNNKHSGDYDRIKSEYDPAYTRVTSFALQNEPEVDDDLPEIERDSDNYDLLRTNKRPERKIDSTYDHIPAETEDDTYNVLQSQDDLHKDDIGDFMYDVTSAINGLGNYDTFQSNRSDDFSGEYDTVESVLHSNS